MRNWSFESKTECTGEDRQLELAINARLGADRGRVACYRDPNGFGLIYTYNGMMKEARSNHFVANPEFWLERIEALRAVMMNQQLPPGWTYDLEEADAEIVIE